ncbi:uncharacterized protein LOC129273769 isoform X1 [Lytechinus pictus]|uniref:uncharacterized protein LOC129273769 isoform X1 n=1 Tax=Lytechinus pictus TaxID=7653 RepID=UPI0030B9F586
MKHLCWPVYHDIGFVVKTAMHLLILVICLLLLPDSNASHYDPHLYPSTGPFFEGWYTRLTDTDNNRSFGVLFGRVLPRINQSTSAGDSAPLTYIGLLRSNGESPMVVVEAYPDEDDIEVTIHGGKPVTGKNPSLQTPSYFEYVARPFGFFNVTPDSTVFNFTIEGVTFAGSFSGPLLWDSTGQGPEGWLSNLPLLPIHWFVYSLGTLGRYTWTHSGSVIYGMAHAHQEKNWGQGFPAGWMWTQAYNRTANATFAGTFGILSYFDTSPTIPAHLFGYRNFERHLHFDFRPDNSFTTQELWPCDGTAAVKIFSPLYILELTMSTPLNTFQKCLRGPVETGFRYNLVETYVATIRIVIKKLGIWGYSVIEDQIFHGAAYEFGRDYLCPKNPCT